MDGASIDENAAGLMSPAVATQSAGAQPAARPAVIVPLAVGLTAVLVAVKVILLPFPVATLGEFCRWLLRLSLVVADDLCFVAGLAAACGGVSYFARRWPRVERCWGGLMFAVFYVAGLYGVLSLPMYNITLVPFTVRLLSFAGGPVMMSSSIAKYVTWPLVLALVFVPIALLYLPRLTRRLPRLSLGWPARLAAIAVTAVFIVSYGVAANAYINSHWTEPNRWERRISQSPHAVLLSSCVEELIKDQPFTATMAFKQIDDRDFHPADPDVPVRTILPASVKLNRPKNVVVFFLESSGAEYLSLYGSKHQTTPHLDKLAAEKGVVFDNLYVQVPNSCKSLVSLSASVYPRPDWRLIVKDSPQFNVPTIAQVLSDQGYRTCYLHSGYWSWRNRDNFLRARGVETLIDAESMPENRINSWGVSDKAMFQSALDWVDAKPSDPFFLLAYTIETHHPYARPENPLDFDVPDAELNDYLNAVRATDERIAWFMGELARRGLEESTLVVVTTDHGESFGQHNQREHMFGVYQPNVHIPLVMFHPSLRDLPRRMPGVREQIDIVPTIVDLLGYQVPPEWQGHHLFREEDGRPAYFFCVGNTVVLGLRDGPWKYHYYVDSGLEELFDLSADAGEEHNLAADQAARCAGYRQRVGALVHYQRKYLAEHGAP